MSETKFTPGTWQPTATQLWYDIAIEIARSPDCMGEVQSVRDDAARSIANAHLIAAAPELYEALEGLLKAGEHEGPCNNMDVDWDGLSGPCGLHLEAYEKRRVKAIAALAKARGEQ